MKFQGKEWNPNPKGKSRSPSREVLYVQVKIVNRPSAWREAHVNLHFGGVGPLMPDDNSLLEFKYDRSRYGNVLTYRESWVEPNVPELNTNTISTRCNWSKIRVCIAVRWEGVFISKDKKGQKKISNVRNSNSRWWMADSMLYSRKS